MLSILLEICYSNLLQIKNSLIWIWFLLLRLVCTAFFLLNIILIRLLLLYNFLCGLVNLFTNSIQITPIVVVNCIICSFNYIVIGLQWQIFLTYGHIFSWSCLVISLFHSPTPMGLAIIIVQFLFFISMDAFLILVKEPSIFKNLSCLPVCLYVFDHLINSLFGDVYRPFLKWFDFALYLFYQFLFIYINVIIVYWCVIRGCFS